MPGDKTVLGTARESIPPRIARAHRRLAFVLGVASLVVIALVATSISAIEMLQAARDRAQSETDALLVLDRLRIAF